MKAVAQHKHTHSRTHLLLLLEDLTLGGLALLGLDAVEELVVDVLAQAHLADVDLGRGGDRVDFVDAAQRATVELERASHEQETRLELLEEHDALFSFTNQLLDSYRHSWIRFVFG